jgi:hypothetical protein
LRKDGYSISIIRNTIVNHPIDNYNLLKRTSRTWRNLKDILVIKEVSAVCKNNNGSLKIRIDLWWLIF